MNKIFPLKRPLHTDTLEPNLPVISSETALLQSINEVTSELMRILLASDPELLSNI